MSELSASVANVLDQIAGFIWGPPLILLLLGTGLLLTIRLKLLQFRELGQALRITFSKGDPTAKGDISHFQSLMTAMSATIGTGNIAGVATAIAAGGPGALFWMWITALVGMATKYSEAILAVKYRTTDEKGEMVGGPMYVLERGLGMKWLGVLFAIFGGIAAFGIGNMVQANSVADSLASSFSVPYWLTGVILAFFVALVILGGIKRIGEVAGYLVPVMAVIYVICALIILIGNLPELPGALWLVVKHAFSPTAAAGGFAGAMVKETLQSGVSRGLFSNESGLGSAPIAAAAARTQNPKRQALVAMTGTFMDTIIVCTMTGLVIITTGVWQTAETGVPLTAEGFQIGFPGQIGEYVVSIGIVFFAYSTILGWGYYGEKCMEYLFGIRAVFPYRMVWVTVVLIGAIIRLDTVWSFADIMNGLMAVPNLIALILLSGVIVQETKRIP